MNDISRRAFVITAATLSGTGARGAVPVKASDLASMIQAQAGSSRPANTVDGFIAGDPDVPVKGIATTAMATMDILKQAAKKGLNFVVSFDGVYYGQAPPPGRGGGGRGRGAPPLGPDDPVFVAKQKFIQENGMAVFRFHDQWAARPGNPLAVGLGDWLGWAKYRNPGDPTSYQIPPVRFEALVTDLRKRLKLRAGLRVVGDRQVSIRNVVIIPGECPITTATQRLPNADLLVTGVTQEWDVTEYAFDMNIAGWKKGFTMLGRVVSEDPGMQNCATWIKTLVKDTPVQWLAMNDPYWRPAKS